MTENPEKIRTEAYIAELPSRKVSMGGRIVTVKWDKETSTVYLMNPDGSWSGKKSKYNMPPENVPQINNSINQEDILSQTSENDAQKTDDTENNPCEERPAGNSIDEDQTAFASKILGMNESEKREPPQEAPSKKKIALIASVIVAGITLALCMALGSRLSTSQMQNPTTIPTSSTAATLPTQPEYNSPTATTTPPTILPSECGVYVLKTNTPLYPGEILTQDMLTETQISDADYQMLSSLYGIYTSNDLEYILSMVVQNYIPAGKYLAFNDVKKTFDPINPWSTINETVNLPISTQKENINALLWGNEVRIEIEVKRQYTAPANTDNTEEETTDTQPEGIEHNSSIVQSTVVDRYIIENARIVDMSDSGSNSLYEAYWKLALVPEIYKNAAIRNMYPTPEDLEKLYPANIQLEVSKDQKTVLEHILSEEYESMTITITSYSSYCTSDIQISYQEKLREVMVALASHWVETSAEDVS